MSAKRIRKGIVSRSQKQGSVYLPDQKQAEAIIDTEDRQPISRAQVSGSPYRLICQLRMQSTAGLKGGSGFLISPKVILTAAHNLYFDNSLSTQIDIYRGRHQNSAFEKRTVGSSSLYVPDSYVAGDGLDDYGVILLDHPFQLGDDSAVLDPRIFSEAQYEDLTRLNVELAGYPLEVRKVDEGNRIFTHRMNFGSTVRNSDYPRVLSHYIDSSEGQSGSPLIIVDSETQRTRVLGIHFYGYKVRQKNLARLITHDMKNQINHWLRDPN